ncbi:MAG: serine hydrolase, partial [Miltoncostaeaceae bacterium]
GAAPPRVSGRVTIARDMAKMLFSIAAVASGDPSARRDTGLTAHQARMALGWLLSSEQRSDNRSLLSGGLPRGTPIAQKNGWIRSARHGAGLIFDPSGTRIAVMLSYDAGGVSLAGGRAVGARVASLAVARR